ncbi:MAG: hypothetical protein AAB772_00765, partial [Patescibacteria group bacterium]
MDNHKDNRKEVIERLKKSAQDLEDKKSRYLRSQAGKKMLKEAIDLGLSWQEMEKIFGRVKSTL